MLTQLHKYSPVPKCSSHKHLGYQPLGVGQSFWEGGSMLLDDHKTPYLVVTS